MVPLNMVSLLDHATMFSIFFSLYKYCKFPYLLIYLLFAVKM